MRTPFTFSPLRRVKQDCSEDPDYVDDFASDHFSIGAAFLDGDSDSRLGVDAAVYPSAGCMHHPGRGCAFHSSGPVHGHADIRGRGSGSCVSARCECP